MSPVPVATPQSHSGHRDIKAERVEAGLAACEWTELLSEPCLLTFTRSHKEPLSQHIWAEAPPACRPHLDLVLGQEEEEPLCSPSWSSFSL